MNPTDEDPMQIDPQDGPKIEAFIREHHRVLKLAAIRILLRAMSYGTAQVEADEVLQEVYLAAWRKGIKGVEKTLLHYFMGIVRYKAFDHLRNRHEYVELDITLYVFRVDLQKDFENRDQLERAISGMAPEEREIIVLSYEGYSGKEMAAHLEISPSAARARLHRAMAKLRKNLEED